MRLLLLQPPTKQPHQETDVMLSRMAQFIIAGVLLLVAAACLFFAGKSFFGRVGLISQQLKSSDWNVSGGRESLDAAIQALHKGDEAEWRTHLLAGSGMAFPISDDARQDTVSDLADRAVSPALLYQRGSGTISYAYAALVDNLSSSPAIDKATRQSASSLLTNFTLPVDDFISYPVDTHPSADVIDLWDHQGVALAQSAKCRGKVGARSGALSKLDAEIAVRPRYAVVDFVRPWMSSKFLEEAESSPDPQISAHFRPGSDLAEIPSSLVVVLPDQVAVTVSDDTSVATVKSLKATGACCRVECLGLEVDLPNGLDPVGDRLFIGGRSAPSPALYALITRRAK